MAEQESVATFKFANQPKLFGKWDYDEVQLADQCFKDYIAVQTLKSCVFVPHTAGCYIYMCDYYQRKKFRKAQCPIVERLAGALMVHDRNTGKIVKACIYLLTGKNPLESYHQLFKEVELEKILQKQEQVVLPNNKQLILHLLKELMKLFIIQLKKLERSFFFVFKIRNNQQLLMIKSINTYHNMARLKNNYNQYVQILIFEKIKFGKSFGSQKQRNYIKLNKVMLQQNFEF
ncbi:unnamed protein product [Paramecium sonneborni]|uniref:Uncharacterized protein n=1 Tax=Paramecium sonneborni TaxID=65129 RepID=A0A8S1RV24_9CILI|nr:unnamed protein product [Paramecium sonneborni]